MLRAILAFGLTRRPIILLALLVFIGGGLLAFAKLNIEAYPNPWCGRSAGSTGLYCVGRLAIKRSAR
jgi:hypothetical protein